MKDCTVSDTNDLYPFTREVLDALGLRNNRIVAHDPTEPDDEDIIYLEEADGNGVSDGPVLCVTTFRSDGKVMAALETAHHDAPWPTGWTSSIAEPEVVLKELKRKLGKR